MEKRNSANIDSIKIQSFRTPDKWEYLRMSLSFHKNVPCPLIKVALNGAVLRKDQNEVYGEINLY